MADAKIYRYGFQWENTPDGFLRAEREAIRRGGNWVDNYGRKQGHGLLYHYLAFRKIVWPKRYEHEWTRLIYENVIQNSGTILMGCASSQKTSHASEWVLIDYWCFPDNTCVLVSTTTADKLESAVFGEIKMLWDEGQSRFPWLAGNLIDNKKWIVTDNIDEKVYSGDNERRAVRDVRKGILGKACYVGRQYVGLGVFAGIKQERFRFLCDELQFMAPTMLDCLPNMRSNTGATGFKLIGSGNPNHDPTAQLTIVAEPKGGWGSVEGVTKTTTWDTNFYGIKCLNLIGTDSPNFQEHQKAKSENKVLPKDPYYRLIGPEFAKIIQHDYGLNSPQWETQVMGRMCLKLSHDRVITRELCQIHGAHDMAVWSGKPRIKIHGCDPAYGRGDRCIQGHVEVGEDMDGKIIIKIYPPQIVRIDTTIKDLKVEDQIARGISEYLDAHGIDPNNSFYDSFGKGTIGHSFSREFGVTPPVPIDAGGLTSNRPVREDLFITDDKGKRRLKTCREHYSKFITEMWFSVRYAIEAGQVRELPKEVMLEGCSREYYTVAGDKIEVEPKDKMRERLGRSPDLFDWLAVTIEGARQRGFRIEKLADASKNAVGPLKNWFDEQRKKSDKLLIRSSLQNV